MRDDQNCLVCMGVELSWVETIHDYFHKVNRNSRITIQTTRCEEDQMSSKLWQPIELGTIHLDHRLAMAPMTREREREREHVRRERRARPRSTRPTTHNVRRWRSSSRGHTALEDGQGYPMTPGIFSADQIAGWRRGDGRGPRGRREDRIQLMHTGRIGHPLNTRHGRQPVAPSG